MFKPSLGLGTQLGAAANKPDLNVGHNVHIQVRFPIEISAEVRYLVIHWIYEMELRKQQIVRYIILEWILIGNRPTAIAMLQARIL